MSLLQQYTPILLLVMLALVVLQFFMLTALSSRVARQARALRTVMTGPEGSDLEAMLKNSLKESHGAMERGDVLEARLNETNDILNRCVQRVGLVRFDAYGDVSGRQSFSLAMLDGRGDGAILTGLFGRNDGRCFGKAVVQGQTEGALSEEEAQALQAALDGAPIGEAPVAPSRNGRRRGRE